MLKGSESKNIRQELRLSQRKVAEDTGINNSEISRFENGRLILRTEQLEQLTGYYREQGAEIPEETAETGKQDTPETGKPQAETGTETAPTPILSPLNVPAVRPPLLPMRPGDAPLATVPAPQTPASAKPKVIRERSIDGIVLPEDMDQDLAENLMNEYHANKQKIARFLDKPVPRKFFGLDIDLELVLRNVLIPMAENFAIVDQIHGQSAIAKWDTVDHEDIHRDRNIETYQDAVEHLFTTPAKA